MGTKFGAFMREIEGEAKAEGPAAVKDLDALRAPFRLGRALAKGRLARGLTQKQVAKLAGIEPADVANIERGRANPKLNTLHALASAVGMEIELKKARRAR